MIRDRAQSSKRPRRPTMSSQTQRTRGSAHLRYRSLDPGLRDHVPQQHRKHQNGRMLADVCNLCCYSRIPYHLSRLLAASRRCSDAASRAAISEALRPTCSPHQPRGQAVHQPDSRGPHLPKTRTHVDLGCEVLIRRDSGSTSLVQDLGPHPVRVHVSKKEKDTCGHGRNV